MWTRSSWGPRLDADHPKSGVLIPCRNTIRVRMRAIANERRRFGYRRVGVMLEREGIVMNHKKLRRLYREEGLAVKRRRGRKRATGTREPLSLPTGPSKRWSLDFLSDVFGQGRRFRILAVNDDFTRECLALVPDTSISGARVARELDAVMRLYGKPETIVSDNGTELTSRAMLEWQNENGVGWHYIVPGKPQQNGFIESFNGRLRDECLNEEALRKPRPREARPQPLAARLQQYPPALGARRKDSSKRAPVA